MKTQIYILLIAVVSLLYGCTKSSTKPDDDDQSTAPVGVSVIRYPVKFQLGNIEVQQSGRVGNREEPAYNYLRYLFYGAYDSTGKLVSKIIQNIYQMPYSNDFGAVSDSLKAGKYTIVLGGGVGEIFGEDNYSDTSLSTLKFYNKYGNDVFYKKFNINVSGKDSLYNNVRLSRLSGLLQVRLTDTLPSNIFYVTVNVDNLRVYFSPNDESLSVTDSLKYYTNYDRVNKPLQSAEYNYYGSNLKHRVTITGLTEFDRPVLQKIIDNIYIYPNQKTILEGTLSDAPVGGNPIVLMLDPSYRDTTIVHF